MNRSSIITLYQHLTQSDPLWFNEMTLSKIICWLIWLILRGILTVLIYTLLGARGMRIRHCGGVWS
jgi:hypothetical protein